MSVSPSSSRSRNSAAEAAAAAIAASGEPWLPGLAAALASGSRGWTAFDKGRAYGTARWLAQDVAVARDVTGKSAIAGAPVLVERLPAAVSGRFKHLGLASEVGPADLDLIHRATELIAKLPGLAASVGRVVRVLHVLRAEEGYDVSHSEPTIPFSIFVSIPGPGENDTVIRLAESIVHEAMHLQLTLVEDSLPLIQTDEEGYSPWQRRRRPVRGLLHGLYVFAVIIRFMDLITVERQDLNAKAFRRRAEIEEEVGELEDFGDCLTESGKLLREKCMQVVDGHPGPLG